jgi:hypothetical protein
VAVCESVENNNNTISSYLHVVPSALREQYLALTSHGDWIPSCPARSNRGTKHQTIGFGSNVVKCAPVDASVISPWPEIESRHKASVDRPYAKKTYKCYHSPDLATQPATLARKKSRFPPGATHIPSFPTNIRSLNPTPTPTPPLVQTRNTKTSRCETS